MKILVQARGTRISFWCPGCDAMMTVCPVRWNWNGDVDRPTLSPSILQRCGPYGDFAPPEKVGTTDICHCFVRDGNIEFCGDCTHDKRGTMPLPDLETLLDIHHEPDGSVWYTRKQRIARRTGVIIDGVECMGEVVYEGDFPPKLGNVTGPSQT